MKSFHDVIEAGLKELDAEVKSFDPADQINDEYLAGVLEALDGASKTQKIAALTGALVSLSVAARDPVAVLLVTTALESTLQIIHQEIAAGAGEALGVDPSKLEALFNRGSAANIAGV